MDETTVRRAQRGDAASLEAVLRDLAPYLGRICGAIALDAGDDALQEAMVAIARNLRSLREPAALRGWARRIAVREAVRAARGGRSIPVDPATLDPVGVDPGAMVSDGTTAVEVRAVLADLAPEQRAVLVLRHLDGLDEAEMAEVLGVARGTVKSRLHRARTAFRERWTA
ncbi:RNA polymerase sigma factor [Iamia sp. SCSIO 61187]|uniref:RNA polymerase sigma factor n=1 Tax=Iamia sp. SCSIO 61187 TaxID=2722752 RepID=UPI001C632E5F|nr:sigma-70 family RNA polymerase sigma factor [Iamia sp. SCSIO 61187]